MSGTIFLASGGVSAFENDGVAIVSIRREGDLSRPVTVAYGITEDGATRGVDFLGDDGTVTLAAGEDQVDIEIELIDDGAGEATEGLVLSLINVSSGALSAPRTVRVDILDDEMPVTDPPRPPLVSEYDVTEEVVIGGLRDPLDFAIAAGDRVYVAEKGGRIAVHEADGAFVANLVDLSAQVNDRQDRGLLDIALHPDFPAQPYLYAFAVIDPPGAAGETGNAAPDGGGQPLRARPAHGGGR